MDKVKITVIKTLNMKDLYGENLPCALDESFAPSCPHFSVGQEFISGAGIEDSYPPGFCAWAFADISRDLNLLRLGGGYPGSKDKGVAIACCTDGVRPVIFKLERIED